MSSHHIIRDEQEPPVLVFQLNDNWQELSELLGWSPILLISRELKVFFESQETKVDGYLSRKEEDSDSHDNSVVYSDSLLAASLLDWISTKNCTAVNIFCDNRLMLDLFDQLKGKGLTIPLVFFTEAGKSILKPNSKFRKWYPSKFRIEILNEDIKSTVNLERESGMHFVVKEGFVCIEVSGDLILLNEKKFGESSS